MICQGGLVLRRGLIMGSESSLEDILNRYFKLSQYESRVYLALLKGVRAPKEVSARSKVPMPRIYDTIRSLESKGFVHPSGTFYKAVVPKAALEARLAEFSTLFQGEQASRSRAMNQFLKLVEPIAKSKFSEQEVVLLRGLNGVVTKFLECSRKATTLFLTIRRGVTVKEIFIPHLQRLVERGKKIKLIFNSNIKLERRDADLLRKIGVEARFSPSVMLDMLVTENGDVMIGVPDPTGEEELSALAIWLHHPAFASSIIRILKDTWRNSSIPNL